MHRRAFALGLVAAALLLSGCADMQQFFRDTEQGNPQAFEMQGRVYVRYGAQAFSGSIRWTHATERDEVWLSGPLGQTGAYIVRDVSGAALTTADQQTYRAMSIESLTKEGLGWGLPLADLSYYVLGTVPTGAPAPDRVPGENASRLSRDGWAVQWTARDGSEGTQRPLRMNLMRDDVEIRLVIDQLRQPQ